MQGAPCQPGLSAHQVLTGRARETWKGEEKEGENEEAERRAQEGGEALALQRRRMNAERTAMKDTHARSRAESVTFKVAADCCTYCTHTQM